MELYPYTLESYLSDHRYDHESPRTWIRHCLSHFEIKVGSFCCTKNDLLFSCWLYFTVQHRVYFKVLNTPGRNSSKTRYCCKECNVGEVLFEMKPTDINMRDGNWEITKIDFEHAIIGCHRYYIHHPGFSRIRCDDIFLKRLMRICKNHIRESIHGRSHASEEDINKKAKKESIHILQDTYTGCDIVSCIRSDSNNSERCLSYVDSDFHVRNKKVNNETYFKYHGFLMRWERKIADLDSL